MKRAATLSIVILVLILAGCGGPSPRSVFDQFVKAVEFQNYFEARDFMNKSSKDFLAGEADLEMYMDRAREYLGDGVEVLDSSSNAMRVEFKYRSRATGATATAALILNDGKWEVVEYQSADELMEDIQK